MALYYVYIVDHSVSVQIVAVGEMVTELKREVGYLEQRNLQLLEEMQRKQLQELEISMYVIHKDTKIFHNQECSL